MAQDLRKLKLRNALLQKAICDISERQEKLEEFIDLEHDAAVFKLFLKNRDRLMFAMGYTLSDLHTKDGKRSPKSLELVRLLRVVKRYQRPSGEKARRMRLETTHPIELQPLKVFINLNTGVIQKKPARKCVKCCDPNHNRRRCPYKLQADRTPEVEAVIQERIEKIKVTELNDPFITNSYKRTMFTPEVLLAAKRANWRRPMEELTALKKFSNSGANLPTETDSSALDAIDMATLPVPHSSTSTGVFVTTPTQSHGPDPAFTPKSNSQKKNKFKGKKKNLNKKKRRRDRARRDQAYLANQGIVVCSDCGRSFESHFALESHVQLIHWHRG